MPGIPLNLAAVLLALLIACLPGCVKQRPVSLEGIQVHRNGQLQPPGTEIAPVVYVNVRDTYPGAEDMRVRTEECFTLPENGFSVTGNPSMAGYILQLTPVAAGQADDDRVAAMVTQGYGEPGQLGEGRGTGLVVDVLMVARDTEKGGSKARLKSVAKRNALSSSQLRIGLYESHRPQGNEPLPQAFQTRLAMELARMLKSGAP
ncbi:MAG: complement resistance protein TraT [Desulfovibrio sp.]|jgi:hypothetical protein|nr:complement resistance protein TraT [Desulfovibrio sp.]